MNIEVYFCCFQYGVYSKDMRKFIRRCYDAEVKTRLQATYSNNEAIILKNEILNTVRDDLSSIMTLEWKSCMPYQEFDIYNPPYRNYVIPENLYQPFDVNSNNQRLLRREIKILAFGDELVNMLRSFVNKILSEN